MTILKTAILVSSMIEAMRIHLIGILTMLLRPPKSLTYQVNYSNSDIFANVIFNFVRFSVS